MSYLEDILDFRKADSMQVTQIKFKVSETFTSGFFNL